MRILTEGDSVVLILFLFRHHPPHNFMAFSNAFLSLSASLWGTRKYGSNVAPFSFRGEEKTLSTGSQFFTGFCPQRVGKRNARKITLIPQLSFLCRQTRLLIDFQFFLLSKTMSPLRSPAQKAGLFFGGTPL